MEPEIQSRPLLPIYSSFEILAIVEARIYGAPPLSKNFFDLYYKTLQI